MNFKTWLLLSENNEERDLAKELTLKFVDDNQIILKKLKEAIPETQKNASKILLLAAYYYSQKKEVEEIKKYIQDYIELLNKDKMKLITVDPKTKKPSIEYLLFTEIIDGHKGEEAAKERKNFQVTDQDFQNEKPIATNPDGTIKVYKANSPQQCIILGKGHSFCISEPGNTMWQSYRDSEEKISTFYFVKDNSRNDRLSTVVIDMTINGPELTDIVNTTGTTLDPFTKKETTDPDSYFKYLKEKGIDISIFEHMPKTTKEVNEQKKLGKQKNDLNWFRSLSPDEKSKYIGRGHKLTDQQFDYLWENKSAFQSLLQQYAKTGLQLNDYQINKIITNSDLRKNYIHNRVLTQRHKVDIQQKEWNFLTKEQKETVYSYVSKPNQFFFLTKVGETEKIKNLIEKNGDIPDEALHLAARYGNLDLVKYLFKIKPNFTHYVINEAIQKNHIDIAKYLIDKGAQIGHTSIKYAAENGNLDFVKYLTKKYLNQIGTNEKDLYIQKYLTQDIVSSATYSGNLDLVKYFIEDLKLQPDIWALSWAAQTGNLDLVKYLIDKGANTYNSLQMAAKMGNLDIVKYLSKFNPNEDDLAEALERAAENQHLNIVKHLVEKEGAILKKPLYSISTTNKEIIQYLKEKFPKK